MIESRNYYLAVSATDQFDVTAIPQHGVLILKLCASFRPVGATISSDLAMI